jgi:hypothetical protein
MRNTELTSQDIVRETGCLSTQGNVHLGFSSLDTTLASAFIT